MGWSTQAHAYASAEILTSGAHQYGRFEASIKFAAGSGVVCSFFLWKDGSEVAGTFWNELDFETVDADCQLKTNPYYGDPAQVHSETAAVATVCGAFHRFTYEWTPDYIAWLVDGTEVRRETGETAAAYRDNTAQGMQLRFNIWPGDASFGGTFDPGLLPVYQYVDWVQYSSWDGAGFVLEWREDFDAGAIPTGWELGTWDSPKGLSTNSVENGGVVDGLLVLALTADDAQGIPGVATTGAGGQGGTSGSGGATTTDGTVDAGGTPVTGMGGMSSTGSDPAGASSVGGATATSGTPTTDGVSPNATATVGTTGSAGTTGTLACSDPALDLCGDYCYDLTASSENCGACGVACAADQYCAAGACAARCAIGLTLCSESCVDTTSNAANCGACGIVCAEGQVCSEGTCSSTCAPGTTQCGQSCVNLATDILNCGGCESSCQAGQSCQAGACIGTPTGGDPSMAATAVDGGPVAATTEPAPVADDGGCSCRFVRSSASPFAIPLALLMFLGAGWRRRR